MGAWAELTRQSRVVMLAGPVLAPVSLQVSHGARACVLRWLTRRQGNPEISIAVAVAIAGLGLAGGASYHSVRGLGGTGSSMALAGKACWVLPLSIHLPDPCPDCGANSLAAFF